KEKLDKQLVEEGANYLSRMPRLEAQRSLRKEYQKLADSGNVEQFKEARDTILAGMRLKRTEALNYADKVLQAVALVEKEYVKEVDPREMVGWGIRSLYRRIDEKLPAEVAEKLAGLKGAKGGALAEVLIEVREKLGKREDLDKHKDIDHTLQTMLPRLDQHTTYIDPDM